MKNKNIYRFLLISLLLFLMISVPASYSKYATAVEYDLKVNSYQHFTVYMGANDTMGYTWTAPYTGYYAFIAKGGDGGKSFKYDLGVHPIEGASGGVVIGYVTIEKDKVIKIYCGNAGSNASKGSVGSGGNNFVSSTNPFCVGGNGSKIPSSWGTLWATNSASAGGGAATIVFNGDYSTNDGGVLMIAAGGGAAGSWDKGYARSGIVESGLGGRGGSNVPNATSEIIKDASTADGDALSGKVFFGLNGTAPIDTDANKYYRYGVGGGLKSAGTGGTDDSYAGSAGTLFSNTSARGNGGAAGGVGGGGGGGYAGGGGGGGSSKTNSCGGGGGGSSYISTVVYDGLPYSFYKLLVEKAGYSLKTDGLPNCADGFVAIMYLGSSDSETLAKIQSLK